MRLLSIYLVSILIYMIIFICTAKVLEPQIRQNGWLYEVPYCENPLLILFCTCAVPIIRVAFIVILIYMSVRTKEEFDAWQSKIEQEIEENEQELERLKREHEELKCIYDYLKNNPEEDE